MHSLKEGGQPSYKYFLFTLLLFTLDIGSRFWIVTTFTIDTAVTYEAGSPCLGMLPSPSSLPPLLHCVSLAG